MHLKSFTQQECLGSLQRLELLYFCSMIFGYEALNQGRGKGGDSPHKQRPVFLMLRACLVLGVRRFHPALCEAETNSAMKLRGCVGLRSCCTGGLMSSPHPWVGCSTAVPGASTPLQLHFPPIFALTHPLPSSTILLSKGKRLLPCVYLFLWTPDQRFRFLGMK